LLAVQEAALLDDQLSVALPPRVIEDGATAIVTAGGDGGGLTVRIAEALVLPPAPMQVRV
jgi:hypothetical protein